jgi:hypothetical protein
VIQKKETMRSGFCELTSGSLAGLAKAKRLADKFENMGAMGETV